MLPQLCSHVNITQPREIISTDLQSVLKHALFYIQGVSRLLDITAGGDFLGLCYQKSSYKHVSDFGRLRSYGHFLIPVHALVRTASYGTSRRVMYSAWWLIVCGSRNEQLAQFTTERQLCCGRRWHFRKPALSTDQFKLEVISRN